MEISYSKTATELRTMIADEKNVSDARAVIASLFDEGTFVEIGTYVKRTVSEFDISHSSEFEGVITGYGAVDGRLTFAFVQDFSRMKGAVSEAHAKKICSLYDIAIKNSAPVIGVFNSAGAAVMEGIGAVSGYGKIMKSVSDASCIIPQIAIITGICSGSAAAIASMMDFVIATEKSQIYVAPPFLIRERNKGEAGVREIGCAAKAAADGVVSLTASDNFDAATKVKQLLYYLPANCNELPACDPTGDDANRFTSGVASTVEADGYDIKSVIAELVDNSSIFELSSSFAPELFTGFAMINSVATAIIANNPMTNGGKITPDAAEKAADFVSFADCFGIPILTLVDTEGFDVSLAAESAPYSTALSKLAFAYSSADTPRVTVVLGKAYGSAFALMGSKALGADIAFALDSAKISIMPPEAAVEFINDKDIKASKVPSKTREYYMNEWKNNTASPLSAARSGDIDDIIDAAELRMRIAAAFAMLNFKNNI